MANQELNQTQIDLPRPASRDKRIAGVLLALMFLALFLLAALSLRNQKQTTDAVRSVVVAKQPFSTQQYWDMAASWETSAPTVEPNPAYSYYTERYWDMAAASAVSSPVIGPETDYSYYTERFWDMIAEWAASARPVKPEPTYSYYTERYWILSR